ncbi:MAG: glutamate-1-semialdehyde 2,1-aminomutase [Euryarchaeota archaeon]|nr:glutamate-1-semialdehyde 2,1-aminomutase [Euryarchaeota archaeon]
MRQETRDHWKEATALLAGGVSSPVRAFHAVGGDPVFLVEGDGAHVRDASGRDYIDLSMAWGPLVLGHARPEVIKAVQETAAKGLHFGACHPLEARLARLIVDHHSAAEKVRFTTSGTEAVMSAVRLARHATGRNKVVAFQGCYHGHADLFLAAGGSGLATFGLSGAPGVPDGTVDDTAFLPLDDLATVRAFFDAHGDEVACVVMEGVPANNGLLVQDPAFVRAVERIAHRHGALLLLDEVITGFRLGPGGATSYYGLKPDLVTFGKVIGGGMPLAAYAGRSDLMDLLAPTGPVYQAGTLSGSPVALAAGVATLETLLSEAPWDHLSHASSRLFSGLVNSAESAGVPFTGQVMDSIVWGLFADGPPPVRPDGITADAVARYARFHQAALRNGVYLPPSAHEVSFVSTAHDDAIIDETTERLGRAMDEVGA